MQGNNFRAIREELYISSKEGSTFYLDFGEGIPEKVAFEQNSR